MDASTTPAEAVTQPIPGATESRPEDAVPAPRRKGGRPKGSKTKKRKARTPRGPLEQLRQAAAQPSPAGVEAELPPDEAPAGAFLPPPSREARAIAGKLLDTMAAFMDAGLPSRPFSQEMAGPLGEDLKTDAARALEVFGPDLGAIDPRWMAGGALALSTLSYLQVAGPKAVQARRQLEAKKVPVPNVPPEAPPPPRARSTVEPMPQPTNGAIDLAAGESAQ